MPLLEIDKNCLWTDDHFLAILALWDALLLAQIKLN